MINATSSDECGEENVYLDRGHVGTRLLRKAQSTVQIPFHGGDDQSLIPNALACLRQQGYSQMGGQSS